MPEVRGCVLQETEDTQRSWMNTNTTRGGAWGGGRSAHGEARSRRARHPKTTLPHRPPGPLAAVGLLGGRPQAPARFGGG